MLQCAVLAGTFAIISIMVSAPLLELTAHPPPVVTVENNTIATLTTLAPAPSPDSSPAPGLETSATRAPAFSSPSPSSGPSTSTSLSTTMGQVLGLNLAGQSGASLAKDTPDEEDLVVYVVDGVRMNARTYRIAIATTLALMIGLLQVRSHSCHCRRSRALRPCTVHIQ